MKPANKIFLPLLLLSCCLVFQTARSQQLTVFDQLAEVNKEWLKLSDAGPILKNQAAFPLAEQELIRQHLRQVEKLLRSRSTAHLTAAQKANREKHLNTLHEYWQAGRFPRNTFHKERTPYFIDIFNTYCAVGYLMQQGGAGAMARDINRSQNFSYLRDIRHPGLEDWVKASGLSVDELALIQPTYGCLPVSVVEIHYDNAGVDVNEYIEVMEQFDPPLPPFMQFTTIDFYDHSGTLYKTLLKSSMPFYSESTRYGGGGNELLIHFYYYVFPPGEALADSGMIIIRNGSSDISRLEYNSAGSVITQYSPGPVATKNYAIIEDGSGPAGTSLNFCMFCPNLSGYNSIMPATYGTINTLCQASLPVNVLHSLYYTLNNDKVQLHWQTEEETNSAYFDLERSAGGTYFSNIGRIASAGNSHSPRTYRFDDTEPALANYYRIKLVDQDGKSSYSKTLFVKIKEGGGLTIYPTLATDQLRVQLGYGLQFSGKLELIDVQGRIFKQYTVKTGMNEINISSLQRGSYFMRLQTDKEGVLTGRFLKQ